MSVTNSRGSVSVARLSPPRWRGFSRDPAVRGIGEGLIETLTPLVYVDGFRGFRIHIKAGFVSDGASVPRWAWALLRSGWVDLLAAGILHDYTYRLLARIIVAGQLIPVPGRLWADRTMAEALRTRPATAGDAKYVRPALAISGWRNWQRRTDTWRP